MPPALPETPPSFTSLSGGDDRNRTGDLLLAKQVLSQLSYVPTPRRRKWVVGPPGFEPGTSPLSGARSDQLSYGPSRAVRWLLERSRPEAQAVCPATTDL